MEKYKNQKGKKTLDFLHKYYTQKQFLIVLELLDTGFSILELPLLTFSYFLHSDLLLLLEELDVFAFSKIHFISGLFESSLLLSNLLKQYSSYLALSAMFFEFRFVLFTKRNDLVLGKSGISTFRLQILISFSWIVFSGRF